MKYALFWVKSVADNMSLWSDNALKTMKKLKLSDMKHWQLWPVKAKMSNICKNLWDMRTDLLKKVLKLRNLLSNIGASDLIFLCKSIY